LDFDVTGFIVNVTEILFGYLGHSSNIWGITIGIRLIRGINAAGDQAATKGAGMTLDAAIDAHASRAGGRMNLI